MPSLQQQALMVWPVLVWFIGDNSWDTDVWTAPSPPPSCEMEAKAWLGSSDLESNKFERIWLQLATNLACFVWPSLNTPTGHVQTCLEICMRRSNTCLEMSLVKFGALKSELNTSRFSFFLFVSIYFSSVLMPLLQRPSRMPCMSTIRFRPSQTDWNKPWHNW